MRGRFFSRCWQVCVYNVCVLELQVNRFPLTLPERRKREEKRASRVSDPVLHAPSSSSGVIRASGGGGRWRVNKRRHGDFPLWRHPSSVQSWSVWRSARRSPVVGGLVLGDGLWRLAVMDSRTERLFYQRVVTLSGGRGWWRGQPRPVLAHLFLCKALLSESGEEKCISSSFSSLKLNSEHLKKQPPLSVNPAQHAVLLEVQW